jgi:hypothetical protein
VSNVESLREFVSGSLSAELYNQRTADGWKLVAVEWKREQEAPRGGTSASLEEVPYGFRIAADCVHLEEEPNEKRALMLVLKMIVKETPLAEIAQELNRNGLNTRSGVPWTAAAVFDLHPRLIEVFPRILAGRDWSERQSS